MGKSYLLQELFVAELCVSKSCVCVTSLCARAEDLCERVVCNEGVCVYVIAQSHSSN